MALQEVTRTAMVASEGLAAPGPASPEKVCEPLAMRREQGAAARERAKLAMEARWSQAAWASVGGSGRAVVHRVRVHRVGHVSSEELHASHCQGPHARSVATS